MENGNLLSEGGEDIQGRFGRAEEEDEILGQNKMPSITN